MTTIQQVVFELEGDYLGHPYYVTGHALYNALARRVEPALRRTLHVSNGVFAPCEYGQYPDTHSWSGGGYMGKTLRPVEHYDDLFTYRDPAQRWLLDSRPRAAHNTQPLQSHGGRLAIAPRCRFGRPPTSRNYKRTVTWYVHCYLHTGGQAETHLPLAEETLDGLRVGGGRNYGFGELSVADSQCVDLETLDYTRLADADDYVLELVAPYVLSSAYPNADDQSIPWWWAPIDERPSSAEQGLRRRDERLVDDGDVYALETVDHGQVVRYTGDDPIQTAQNGVLRVGTHARFGYGEFRVRPAGNDRVPERDGQLGQRPPAPAATQPQEGD